MEEKEMWQRLKAYARNLEATISRGELYRDTFAGLFERSGDEARQDAYKASRDSLYRWFPELRRELEQED